MCSRFFFAMQRGHCFFDKADKKNLQNRMAWTVVYEGNNMTARPKWLARIVKIVHSIDNQAPIAWLPCAFSAPMVSRPTNNGGPVMWQRGLRCHSIGIPLHCNGASVATQRGPHCNTTERVLWKSTDCQTVTKRAENSQIFGLLACWWSGNDSRARSRHKRIHAVQVGTGPATIWLGFFGKTNKNTKYK